MTNTPYSPWQKPRNPVLNSLAAIQFSFFRRPKKGISGRPRDVLVAIAILFLVNLAINRSYFPGEVVFSAYGLQLWLGGTSSWILTIAVVTTALNLEARLGSVLVIASIAGVVGSVLAHLWYRMTFGHLTDQYIAYWSYIFVGMAPLFIALAVLTSMERLRGAIAGLTIASASALVSFGVANHFNQAYLFEMVEHDSSTNTRDEWQYPDPEVIYPMQSILLKQQVASLLDQVPGQIDIYALLGAGYPIQTIFQREVSEFKGVLENRFDAHGRTLRLGATMDDPTSWPLLNRTNVTQGLKALSEKMDTEEDVALIFLTSHGAPDQISTSFTGLSFLDLTSKELAVALDNSGIQHAIVIISACYSGSFVDDLQSPNRIVITASADDRNSFGCNDDNELTDWGSAFIANALNQTYDFRQAASIASELVAKSESERELTPSLPQVSVGQNIGVLLDGLAKRFQASG